MLTLFRSENISEWPGQLTYLEELVDARHCRRFGVVAGRHEAGLVAYWQAIINRKLRIQIGPEKRAGQSNAHH